MVRHARLCCAVVHCLLSHVAACNLLTPGASACVLAFQIRFILLQNRQGRTRLAKYYVPLDDGEKRKLETDIHRLVVNRDPKATNFVEVRSLVLRCALALLRSS